VKKSFLVLLVFFFPISARVWAQPGPPPPNDECVDAIPLSVPDSVTGSTIDATDSEAPFCDTDVSAPGVWYTVTGTGNTMTATTCDGFAYDTKINVYCSGCDTLICVGGDDDSECETNGLLSTVTWCSRPGVPYLILVDGFDGATGDFDLSISDNGVPCEGAVDCEAPPPPQIPTLNQWGKIITIAVVGLFAVIGLFAMRRRNAVTS
jgi:hypothetical protein